MLYRIEDEVLALTLTRTSTLSNLFGKNCRRMEVIQYGGFSLLGFFTRAVI
ncbi:MAG: hypothetical protein IJ899_19135 [Blautia sp.]|nr:hypothetical protein [Blautia sp.]